MFRNFIISGRRNLLKNKGYTLLNILGLSAGLTCFALIALWANDELGYDKFNKNYERIVRLTGMAKTETGISESAVSSAPMAKALKEDYAEIENTVRMDINDEAIVEHHQQRILERNILFTDPSFFKVFSFNLTQGDPATALKEPYSIILTETTSKKYFGDRDPIGQVLTLFLYDSGSNGASYKVTGVMPDAPHDSHIQFNIIGSFKTVEVNDPDVLTIDGWGDASYYTYLLLKEGVDPVALSSKISQFYAKYIGEMYSVWKSIYFYKLQSLRDIHLRSHLQYEISANGNINQVHIFSIIGIFILLLAGINYTNLSTARSVSRAKEVGIKKVVGAGRRQLVVEHLSEAVLTAIIALVVSLILGSLLQKVFLQLTGKDLSLLSSYPLLGFLLVITILLGILSGIYPAFIISGFKPSTVLKGAFKGGSRGVSLRKSLVVAQFTITLILVTGIIVINSQMSYIKHKDLGYDKEALLFLRVHGNTDVINGYMAFRNELLTNPLVTGTATSNSLPVAGLGTGGSETVDGYGKPLQVNTARLRVDPDFLGVYGIKLTAGRSFSATAVADTIRLVMLNETAVKNFGWKDAESAIGKPFRIGGQGGVVRAVVKDFHFNSLQEPIGPIAIYPLEDMFSRITIRVDVDNASQAIAWIEKNWKQHFPSALLDYGFLDRQLGEQYLAEERFSKIFLYFSILALLIACLGLFGLISYSVAQRTKEIGIRKIIGASAKGIALMLSGNFLKLVVLAIIIATPITWWVMNKWLEDFAYRVHVSWWMFALAGIAALLIAFLTVSIQSVRAAIANPVKSLRTE